MIVDSELQQRITTIQWFVNCEKNDPLVLRIPAKRVSSWTEAAHFFFGQAWDDLLQDAANEITSYLADKHSNEYHGHWNRIADAVRTFVNDVVRPSIPAFHYDPSMEREFRGRIGWSIGFAILESHYEKCRPPLFFRELLAVYEAGHLPCGWEGKWPRGTLLYY